MQPIHHSSFSIPRAHNSQHSPTRSLLNQSNVNHISHGLLQTPLNSTPPKSPQFLELCVNIGEYLKVLGEIPTGNISNDQELFQSIKKKYLELRGFRARFWLLKPSAVNSTRSPSKTVTEWEFSKNLLPYPRRSKSMQNVIRMIRVLSLEVYQSQITSSCIT